MLFFNKGFFIISVVNGHQTSIEWLLNPMALRFIGLNRFNISFAMSGNRISSKSRGF